MLALRCRQKRGRRTSSWARKRRGVYEERKVVTVVGRKGKPILSNAFLRPATSKKREGVFAPPRRLYKGKMARPCF